ncbi:hypothetical protein BGZ94_002606, partial [Podila epigama]
LALQNACQKVGGACISVVGVYTVRVALQMRVVKAGILMCFRSALNVTAFRAARSGGARCGIGDEAGGRPTPPFLQTGGDGEGNSNNNALELPEKPDQQLEEQDTKTPFRGLQIGSSNRENIFLAVLFLHDNLREIAKPEDDNFHFGLGKEGQGFRQLASLLSKAEPTLAHVISGSFHSLYERVLKERRDLTNFLKRETGSGWKDTRFSEIAHELVAIVDEIADRDNRRNAARENRIAEQAVVTKRITHQMMHPLGPRKKPIEIETQESDHTNTDIVESEVASLEPDDRAASTISSTPNPEDAQMSSKDNTAPLVLTPWQDHQAPTDFFTSHGPSNPSRSHTVGKRKATFESDISITLDRLAARSEDNERRQNAVDTMVSAIQHELKDIRAAVQQELKDIRAERQQELNEIRGEINKLSHSLSSAIYMRNAECLSRYAQQDVIIKALQHIYMSTPDTHVASSHQIVSLPIQSHYDPAHLHWYDPNIVMALILDRMILLLASIKLVHRAANPVMCAINKGKHAAITDEVSTGGNIIRTSLEVAGRQADVVVKANASSFINDLQPDGVPGRGLGIGSFGYVLRQRFPQEEAGAPTDNRSLVVLHLNVLPRLYDASAVDNEEDGRNAGRAEDDDVDNDNNDLVEDFSEVGEHEEAGVDEEAKNVLLNPS